MQETYDRYAILKMEEKRIADEIDSLKGSIIADMEAQGESKIEVPMGTFSISKRKTWKYTPKTQELAEELKGIQAQEQETGDAEFTESPSLMFKAVAI